MAKSLVIVESPAKVKTISKFLGPDYVVKSSVGHIRDLAKTGDASSIKKKVTKTAGKSKAADKESKEDKDIKKLVTRMGVDPYQDWAALYEIIPGKEKVLKGLKEAADSVGTIYLATDLDREGEAIAWHLRESIGGEKSRYKRVTFTEITKKAIKDAFLTPTTLNINRVNAQQARRFLDRVVGYMLSPLLWAKVARGLSAGRVQSVAVRLISEREREIHAFKPEEYWEVFVDLIGQAPLSAQVVKHGGKPFRPASAKEIDAPLKVLNTSPYRVTEVDKKPTTSRPSAPFITSTLQQAASVRFGYGVKKTMMLAQGLYEAGYITYMRTDSTNLSQDAVSSCREYISKHFGKAYLPQDPNVFASKKSAQEAHEAIRPTDVNFKLSEITQDKDIDPDARKLYDLIWRQFVACQMTPAQYNSTSVSIECGSYELKARGRVLKFDGYLRVQPQMKKAKEEESELPELKESDSLALEEVKPSQHFTKPPPRFTDASLVRELEKQGIGRPSTYAAIISTIQDRGYVRVENRRFFCLKMGEIVTDRLFENFDDLMDYGFTAALEEELDKIADGEADWKEVLNQFYAKFYSKLKKASVDMRENDPTMTDVPCPQCNRPMQIRTARTGVFLSCSGYNLPPAERCKGTINLTPGDEYITASKHSVEDDDEGDVAELQAKKRCAKCDTAMDSYLIDEARKLHVCGNNPDCDGFQIEKGKFKLKGYEGPIITCDKCNSNMQLKTGRFGKYFACNAAPTCKNTRKLLRNGEAAPPKSDPVHMTELKCTKSDGYFVLRDGASGLFLAASTFPKSRETRKPMVSDLKRHRQELDPKYHFLADAPEKDPDGYPAQIRFSRKTKEHFVASETEEGKATGWSMYFSKGKWAKG